MLVLFVFSLEGNKNLLLVLNKAAGEQTSLKVTASTVNFFLSWSKSLKSRYFRL